MPELPEVETIRQGLEGRLVGRHITGVEVRTAKLFEGDSAALVGREVLSLDRYGKLLVMRLQGGEVLTIHLKMTGQLIWKPRPVAEREEVLERDNAELPFELEDEEEEEEAVMGGHPEQAYLQPLPHKHTHLIISFDDGSHLYFNDLRKFGRVSLLSQEELAKLSFLNALGPEPLDATFTIEYLAGRLKRHPRVAIKSFLLDQANLAGLGNIYADESLFRAAILPDRLAGELTMGEVRNLHESIQETLELALRYGGSSSRDYVNAVGERGTFLKVANVYHRQGLGCNRCLTGVIQRKKIGGRSSHYCAICQR